MLQMLSSSPGLVGFRVIGGRLTSPIKELTEELTSRIAPAKLGPMLVKYTYRIYQQFPRDPLYIVLPSDSNDEGNGARLLRLFTISLSNFQVVLKPFLALSNLVS